MDERKSDRQEVDIDRVRRFQRQQNDDDNNNKNTNADDDDNIIGKKVEQVRDR